MADLMSCLKSKIATDSNRSTRKFYYSMLFQSDISSRVDVTSDQQFVVGTSLAMAGSRHQNDGNRLQNEMINNQNNNQGQFNLVCYFFLYKFLIYHKFDIVFGRRCSSFFYQFINLTYIATFIDASSIYSIFVIVAVVRRRAL